MFDNKYTKAAEKYQFDNFPEEGAIRISGTNLDDGIYLINGIRKYYSTGIWKDATLTDTKETYQKCSSGKESE